MHGDDIPVQRLSVHSCLYIGRTGDLASIECLLIELVSSQ